MKLLYMLALFLTTLILTSCSNSDKTSCNLDCNSWEICIVNECKLKSNYCNSDDDCSGTSCNENHRCVITQIENKNPNLNISSNNSIITHHDTLKLKADAQDSDGSIVAVKFMLDGKPLATLKEEPYILSLTPSVGIHRYSAIAIDDKGAVSDLKTLNIEVKPIVWGENPELSVKTEHPYLFVNREVIDASKSSTELMSELGEYVSSRYISSLSEEEMFGAIDKRIRSFNHLLHYVNMAMWVGMDAYFRKTPESIHYAREYVKAIIALPSVYYPAVLLNADEIKEDSSIKAIWEGSRPSDAHPRGKVAALGMIYDWVYASFDESEKKEIRAEIMKQIEYMDGSITNWKFFTKPSYTGGHSRLANIYSLIALLAIYHDIKQDGEELVKRYNYFLQKVLNNMESGYNPYVAWSSVNGGSEKGWAYGTGYNSPQAALVWSYATDELAWFDKSMSEKADFCLYGLRNMNEYNEYKKGGFYNFPYSGDVWATDYGRAWHGLSLITASSKFDNQEASWLYNSMTATDSYYHILYSNLMTRAKVPDDLPLSKHFYNAGYVVMRDSWDVEKNTLTVFKSTSFSSINHHHRDQNAFTIFYKGPLAIDSGGYNVMGAYGSKHWWNYYTRSIAHNTILVYDPDEFFGQYSLNGDKHNLSNDGGQIIRADNYPKLSDMKLGGASSLDGVVYYEEGVDYVYTMGDASKAYNPDKLKTFKRHLISLRNHSYNHPVTIVYDQVESSNASFLKTYLLHSSAKPIVQAENPSIYKITMTDGINNETENQAHLYQQTILPLNAKISLVGGVGEEFLVKDDGNGSPHNYIEGRIPVENQNMTHKIALKEAGEWRIEVNPSDSSINNRFLHVLSVTDAGVNDKAVKAKYFNSNNLDAVLLEDNDGLEKTLVVFIRDSINTEISELNLSSKYKSLLITGLLPYSSYIVESNNNKLMIHKNIKGKYRSSSEGVIYKK